MRPGEMECAHKVSKEALLEQDFLWGKLGTQSM